MAGVVEVVFLLQLLVFVGLWFFKLYNVVTGMDKFSNGVVWLVTIGLFLCYGIGFITFLTGEYSIFYATIFSLETLMFYLVWMFLFIELFVYIGRKSTGERSAFKSLEDR